MNRPTAAMSARRGLSDIAEEQATVEQGVFGYYMSGGPGRSSRGASTSTPFPGKLCSRTERQFPQPDLVRAL